MNANTVTTGEVRLSYCNLFQPYAATAKEEPQYSVTALIPKTDTNTLNSIYAAVEAAKVNGISTKWEGRLPAILDITLRDGDGPRPSDGEPYGPECRGQMVLKCKTKMRPYVVDQNIQDVLEPGKVYSGCYGRVNVTFIPYDSNGKKGVTGLLNGVQFLREGEPLGGGVMAQEAFGTTAAPTMTTYSTQAYAPQQMPSPSHPQQPMAPAAAWPAAPVYPQQPAPAYSAAPAWPQPSGMPVMGL